MLPLRVDEVLQLQASREGSMTGLIAWVARTPGAAPLNYVFQAPVIAMLGNSRLSARMLTFVFAVAACYVFSHLADRISKIYRQQATMVFAVLPAHYVAAVSATPAEQGLFFLLLGTVWFFRLVSTPTIASAAVYSSLLTLCIYSQPYTFLPTIGYVLFLLRFVDRAHERRALWYVLSATALPPLLFLPYYIWATPQADPNWLFAPSGATPVYTQAFAQLSAAGALSYLLSGIMIVGALTAGWISFRARTLAFAKRIALFCLFGGILTTGALTVVFDTLNRSPVRISHMLGATPAAILLCFAALQWASVAFAKTFTRRAASIVAATLAVLCVASDAQYLRANRTVDLRAEASALATEVTPDSCVVFVSEHLSRYLFLVFHPELEYRECRQFFQGKVVLAIHPFVRLDQRQDAETYFRGLGFAESRRLRVGGGEIVTFRQNR
ncbi:MAG: hypothetical protein JOZ62_03250 [Acidobacteriaceae bacterium]|nr:hypothetical protein [Acidobacteriaceae bacterium]